MDLGEMCLRASEVAGIAYAILNLGNYASKFYNLRDIKKDDSSDAETNTIAEVVGAYKILPWPLDNIYLNKRLGKLYKPFKKVLEKP